mmetsp:Transcript_6161/g.7102  ORF Transcript_6161/g.7102 Transcript_6161/m.7102 type:complete len:140 (+) Transcript_6161:247-666(+)
MTPRKRAHETNRSKLLHGSNPSTSVRNRKHKKSSSSSTAAQEAKDITSSLSRTKAMMRQELERMSNVTESIQHDGKMLQQTKEEQMGMKGGIQGAKGSFALLKLKEREDEIIFWSSVVFFFIVALYVLWTRIRIPFLLW